MTKNKLCIIDKDEVIEAIRNNEFSENTIIFASIGYTEPINEENDALFYVNDLYKASTFIIENYSKYIIDIINIEEIANLFKKYIEMIKHSIFPDQEAISEEIISLVRQNFDK